MLVFFAAFISAVPLCADHKGKMKTRCHLLLTESFFFFFKLYACHLITCKYLLQKQNTFNSRKEKSVKTDKPKNKIK